MRPTPHLSRHKAQSTCDYDERAGEASPCLSLLLGKTESFLQRTRLRAQAYPGEDPAKLPEPGALAEAFVALAEVGCARHGELIAPSGAT